MSDYRSNLTCPDLRKHFKLLDPPIQLMPGHDSPSDPDFEPACTSWTMDEAAILYHVARQIGGVWIDVGARFGWTAAHLGAAGCMVALVDPHFSEHEREKRLRENIGDCWYGICVMDKPFQDCPFPETIVGDISGIVIDGNHDSPEPLKDAIHAAELHAKVIVFHDAWGEPIQDGIRYLLDIGYCMELFNTPNGVCVCWLPSIEEFAPPSHTPDPRVDWKAKREQSSLFRSQK